MCSSIIMDNYQGDLTDIVRGSSGGGAYGGSSSCSTGTTSSSSELSIHYHHWHQQHNFSSSSDPLNFSSVLEDPLNFGDPFSTMRDPFLQELDLPSASAYFTPSAGLEDPTFAAAVSGNNNINTGNTATATNTTTTTPVFAAHKILEDHHHHHHDMRRPCKNIFSNMIQISPNNSNAKLPFDSSSTLAPSPRAIKPSAVVSPNMVNANSSKDCLVDTSGVQISSPRNPGLKRRKNQAKKVVCIPAPAAANSRQTGEVVPSDLWAWRKYGQKPIKGSPYPRGYYRCSSSKGCSARKQVERSRTDPNMLVITYTSEHNHPWPTQRNALAGSTRSQPSKHNNAANSKNSESSNSQKKAKEEQQQQQESNNSEGNVSPVVAGNSANSASVKEENMEDIEKQFDMDEGEFSDGVLPYKPCMMDQSNNQSEDFFAELGELEADPLNLLFTQGFGAPDDQRESKALDPFHLFDWSGDTATKNTNSFGEPNNKRRL
ncbi:hypothetical protein RJT34_14536 [Clitoria ternatea]|uniref:WRKY domain-containing protein n=1 Tax=Clitoria ternatea TaxID=43366 RepID=A0AAN9JSP3_CLITE